jgi:hypothetical protein
MSGGMRSVAPARFAGSRMLRFVKRAGLALSAIRTLTQCIFYCIDNTIWQLTVTTVRSELEQRLDRPLPDAAHLPLP